MRLAFSLLASVALSGCATNFEPQPLSATHPANIQAQEAPRTAMKRLTASDQLTEKTKVLLARTETPKPDFESGGMSHDMSSMPGMQHDMGKMETKQAGGHPKGAANIYTCVHHPDVRQPAPGNCPKCGMALVKKEGAAR